MADIEKIQDAEAKVAQMQDALAAVQSGLHRAEQVAVAAEQAKVRAERAVKLTFALVGLSVVLIGLSLRNHTLSDHTDEPGRATHVPLTTDNNGQHRYPPARARVHVTPGQRT